MDLIERQKAIDALANTKDLVDVTWTDENDNVIDSIEEKRNIIANWLEKVPAAQPERKWVPLDSGRFPDDSGTYIVTAYDGAKERVTFAKYQKRLKRWELTGARAYWRVLAWMSPPTPYEERREE